MNPVTGEKAVVIGGQPCAMRFTWRALAEIESRFGDNPNLFNAEVVAAVAAAGLRDRHPDLTAERIMDLSPPLIPFARDVQQALRWAYFGPEDVPEGSTGVKKNSRAGGLWRRFTRLCGRVLLLSNSGA